jgi:hypothetical protein
MAVAVCSCVHMHRHRHKHRQTRIWLRLHRLHGDVFSSHDHAKRTYLDHEGEGKRDQSNFHLLSDGRVERDSKESSWCNREQYLLVDVLEDRHDNERTIGKVGRRKL